jgi:hypothetical protein
MFRDKASPVHTWEHPLPPGMDEIGGVLMGILESPFYFTDAS